VEEPQIKAILEALIFVSETPVGIDQMREVLGDVSRKDLQRILAEMTAEYTQAMRGFTLIEVGGGYQFRTRPDYGEWIKKLKKISPFSEQKLKESEESIQVEFCAPFLKRNLSRF
jgi:segregation and condensation protein B